MSPEQQTATDTEKPWQKCHLANTKAHNAPAGEHSAYIIWVSTETSSGIHKLGFAFTPDATNNK